MASSTPRERLGPPSVFARLQNAHRACALWARGLSGGANAAGSGGRGGIAPRMVRRVPIGARTRDDQFAAGPVAKVVEAVVEDGDVTGAQGIHGFRAGRAGHAHRGSRDQASTALEV